ncbi:MAG: hypothetical protein WD069_01480 [Planctomycetales bacterium]
MTLLGIVAVETVHDQAHAHPARELDILTNRPEPLDEGGKPIDIG